MILDIQLIHIKLKNLLWQPLVSLQKGIFDTVKWYKENQDWLN